MDNSANKVAWDAGQRATHWSMAITFAAYFALGWGGWLIFGQNGIGIALLAFATTGIFAGIFLGDMLRVRALKKAGVKWVAFGTYEFTGHAKDGK